MSGGGYSVKIGKRAGNPFWWATVYLAGEGGRRRRFSTGVTIAGKESKRDAERVARERADALAAEVAEPVAAAPKTSLGEVATRMLAAKVADGRRDRGVDSLSFWLDKHVLPYFGRDRDVRTIRRADLESFKAHLRSVQLDNRSGRTGMSPQSINNALTAARQVLKHACFVDEMIESVPQVANVRTDPTPKWRLLTADEIGRLLDEIPEREREARHYLLFVANTGMRKSEVLAMRWPWVDWERGRLVVPASETKGGRGRHPVELNEMALAVLRERKALHSARVNPEDDRVWREQKHDVARNEAAKRAGLGRVRTHDLRHSFASLAHAAGASLVEVADMLGHTTLAMVRRYGHSFDDRRKEIAAKVQIGVAGGVAGRPKKGAKIGQNTRHSAKQGRRKAQ